MVLFLGTAAKADSYQPVTIPDEYSVEDAVSLIPGFWWGDGNPLWTASDDPALAEAAAAAYGGLPIYELNNDGFPVSTRK